MPESVNALEQYYRDLGPATANPNFLAQGRRANVAQRSMPGPTMQAANTQLAKEFRSMGNRGAIPDLINRGLIANTAGLPVDMLNTVLQSLGLGAEQPVGGSDSIRRALEYYGLSSDTQRPMLETLTGLTPPRAVMGAARAAGQGAEAVGRAAAPVAGQAIENYLVRSGGILPMHVYHGTPHRFPPTANNPLGEFDPMKIGTGEGAQAYGVGAGYLAEAKGLAAGYRDNLAHKGALDLEYEAGKRGIPLNREAQVEFMRQSIPNVSPEKAAKSFQNANIEARNLDQNKLTALFKDYKESKQGNLYKVDLPDEQIAKMLDWDKPLSQQPAALNPLLKDVKNAGAFAAEKVKLLAQQPGLADWAKRDLMNDAAQIATSKSPQHVSGVLKRMQLDYGISPDSGPFKNVAQDFLDFAKGMQEVPNMNTGGGAVSYLKARYGANAASKMLQEAGIPGIRYLDQGSRAGGAGTSNFVVFDPKHMNIIGRE